MKLHLSVALAAILIAGTVSAQSVNVGIKGGLNVYNINNDNGVSNYDTKPGFNLGVLGHIHLARQIALQPEVVFSTQGAKFKNQQGVDTKINLNYVNVPVLVQYMFDNGFRLQAGPQVGFLASAKRKTGSVEVNTKDNYKSIDFGLSAGVGYVHPPTGFGVDARYNLGLSDINDNNPTNITSTNRGVQLGVFYLFNHKN